MQMIMGPFTYTMQMTHANSPGDKIVCLYNGTLAIIQVDLWYKYRTGLKLENHLYLWDYWTKSLETLYIAAVRAAKH